MTFVYRESWVDPRLTYKPRENLKYLNLVLSDELHIWRPDTFFVNEHDANPLEAGQWDNLYRLYPDGKVFFSVKLKHDFTCPIDLWKYPFEWTKCSVKISSFTANRNNLRFQWSKKNPIRKAGDFPEKIGDYYLIDHPHYEVQNDHKPPEDNLDSDGPYSMVCLDVVLGRRMKYMTEMILAPAGFVILALIVFASPKWLTHGPIFITCLFIGQLIFNAGIYVAFPLARHSFVIHYLTGLSSILFSEAIIIALIGLGFSCLCRGSSQSRRDLEMSFSYSPFSGVEHEVATDDMRPLEPPKPDEFRKLQILDKLRYVILAVYIFIFIIYMFVFFTQALN